MQKTDILGKLQGIVGDRNVSTSSAELYCYSCDASQIRGMPDYVIRPENTEQVSKVVKVAYDHEIPVTARGAATGLAGGAVPVEGGIVLDMSSMDKIEELDLDN